MRGSCSDRLGLDLLSVLIFHYLHTVSHRLSVMLVKKKKLEFHSETDKTGNNYLVICRRAQIYAPNGAFHSEVRGKWCVCGLGCHCYI